MKLPDVSVTTGQTHAAGEAAFGNGPMGQPWNEIEIGDPNTWTKEVAKSPGQRVSVTVWELNSTTS